MAKVEKEKKRTYILFYILLVLQVLNDFWYIFVVINGNVSTNSDSEFGKHLWYIIEGII